jgi:outer membrane protein assembly factor BamB
MRLFPLLAASAAILSAQVAVTTHHNDVNRTGAYLKETLLNTSNVSLGTFGKLFSRTVDGQIYAQPLYAPNVTVPGNGLHNVVYVCTEHNSVYAFDADNAAQTAPLWHVNFGPTSSGVTRAIEPEVGITSTPVIDLSSNTMYVVSESTPGGTTIFQLHALDITNGHEKFGGPVSIQGSVSGVGDASNPRCTGNDLACCS